jgi:pyruvate dehydrogenase E2 component (dihydrolipoamide acetyltransferase)
MPELLRMPEVAANTTEAVLLSWPVAENVPFASRDTIAVVETAKAVVDVEAEADGVILRTLVPEGTEVAVGEPIALIARTEEVVDDIEATLLRLGFSPDTKAPLAIEIPEADPAPALAVSPAAGRIFASPLARRLARDANLVLDALTGSGPNNRIVRRDVEAAIRLRRDAGPEPAATNGAAASNGAAVARPTRKTGSSTFTDVPLSRQRRLIAERLTSSKQVTPHFYLRGTARVDGLLALRAELNDGAETRVSVNDLMVKAVALAHVRVPALNVSFADEAIRHFDSVDVSVAVATESGLLTPVIRSAQTRTVTDIAATVRDFVARAKSGQLRQHDLEGGSVTLTNLGMYGVQEFAAIINPPQASILAVGAARQEPVVRKGKLRVASVIRLTLSADHRAVDGAQAAEWMAALLSLVEHPVRILG